MRSALTITCGHEASDWVQVRKENEGADTALNFHSAGSTAIILFMSSPMAIGMAQAILRAHGLPVPATTSIKEIEHVA